MAFFDKLGGLAKNIGDKTSDAIEINKLNSRINSEKAAAGEEMKKIGEFYYDFFPGEERSRPRCWNSAARRRRTSTPWKWHSLRLNASGRKMRCRRQLIPSPRMLFPLRKLLPAARALPAGPQICPAPSSAANAAQSWKRPRPFRCSRSVRAAVIRLQRA